MKAFWLGLVAVALAPPGWGQTVEAEPETVVVVLRGGSTLRGVLLDPHGDDEAMKVRVQTDSGVIEVPREAVMAIRRQAAPGKGGDPSSTRLMFAPTARSLGKGDGYFSDHYVLFPGF